MKYWQQKALGIYDPSGYLAKGTEYVRVATKNYIGDYLDKSKEYYKKAHELKGKAIYGKKFTKSPSKVKNFFMTVVMDVAKAKANDLLDGNFKSSSGVDVANSIVSGRIALDYRAGIELKNSTGYNFDALQAMDRLIGELKHEDEKYHYNKEWREKMMPEILKASYLDERKRMLEAIKNNFMTPVDGRPLPSKALMKATMLDGINRLGKMYEKFGEDLAEYTDYLDVPPRFMEDPAADLAEKPEIPKDYTLISQKELDEKWAKFKRPGLTSLNEIEKELNTALEDIKVDGPSEAKNAEEYFNIQREDPNTWSNTIYDMAQTTMGVGSNIGSMLKGVFNAGYSVGKEVASVVSRDDEKKTAEIVYKEAGITPEAAEKLNTWQQKALGIYIPSGLSTNIKGQVKVYGKRLVADMMSNQKQNVEEESKKSFKAIYGKTYGSNSKSTKRGAKLKGFAVKKVMDTAEAFVKDMIDGKNASATGVKVAEAVGQNVTLDEKNVRELYNSTGYKFNTEKFMENFQNELKKEDQIASYNSTWREKMMPEILQAAYKDEMEKMINQINKEFLSPQDPNAEKPKTASRDLYKAALISGTQNLGKIFEDLGMQLATKTDYLDVPPRFVQNAETRQEDLRAMPTGLSPKLQEKWKQKAVRPGLINAKALDERLNKELKQYKLPSADQTREMIAELKNAPMRNPDTNQAEPYVHGKSVSEDVIRETRGVMLLRDLKAKNEARGFFNRLFNRSEYKKELQAISDLKNELKTTFGLKDDYIEEHSDPKKEVVAPADFAKLHGIDIMPEPTLTEVVMNTLTDQAYKIGEKAVNIVSNTVGAGLYVAEKGLEGVQYVAEKGLEGAQYVAEKGLEGVQYVAEKGVEGVQYVAEKGVEGVQYVAQMASEGMGMIVNGTSTVVNSVFNIAKSTFNVGYNLINYFSGSSENPEETKTEEKVEEKVEENTKDIAEEKVDENKFEKINVAPEKTRDDSSIGYNKSEEAKFDEMMDILEEGEYEKIQKAELGDVYNDIQQNPELQKDVPTEGSYSLTDNIWYLMSFAKTSLKDKETSRREYNQHIDKTCENLAQQISNSYETIQQNGETKGDQNKLLEEGMRVRAASIMYLTDVKLKLNLEANSGNMFDAGKYLDEQHLHNGAKLVGESRAFKNIYDNLSLEEKSKFSAASIHSEMITERIRLKNENLKKADKKLDSFEKIKESINSKPEKEEKKSARTV